MENKRLLKAKQDYINLRAKLAKEALFVKPRPLKSAQQVHQQGVEEAEKSVEELTASCEKGFTLLAEHLTPDEKNMLVAALEPLKALDADHIKTLMHSELFVHQALGISDATVNILYQLAKKLLSDHNYDGAYHVFLILAILCPLSLEVWLGLGRACQECKRYEEATLYYERALELNPQSALAQAYAKTL